MANLVRIDLAPVAATSTVMELMMGDLIIVMAPAAAPATAATMSGVIMIELITAKRMV